MKRAITIGLWLVLGGLTACSGGAHQGGIPYTSGSASYGYDDGEDDEDSGGRDDGIDPDGPRPPPPPPGDDGPRPPGGGDCCEANDSPGCDNAVVQQCVCDVDSFCCESTWDKGCTMLVEDLECGHCAANEPPPPPDGDCCREHDAPGCDDPGIQACVCEVEPFCCDNQWSAACLAVMEVHGCGTCEDEPPPPGGDEGGEPPPGGDDGGEPPPPGGDDGGGGDGGGSDGGGGDGGAPVGTGACCESNGSPGCDDMAIQECVCAMDEYCCDVTWDAQCAGQVDSFMCGECVGEISACCEEQAGPGCPDSGVEACVCAMDDYCCATEWDALCVSEVLSFGCGSCG